MISLDKVHGEDLVIEIWDIQNDCPKNLEKFVTITLPGPPPPYIPCTKLPIKEPLDNQFKKDSSRKWGT